ncbi:hypothetical protein PDJAM_G00089900 [Pangasius djambal]|uniref:Uncharacterized protein n=1 Tax=Pangasius djambal TaxID=1691987 RepID=A0ACC5Z5F7_9TELE|nr:hypothetical protein [Pangasius djambal]
MRCSLQHQSASALTHHQQHPGKEVQVEIQHKAEKNLRFHTPLSVLPPLFLNLSFTFCHNTCTSDMYGAQEIPVATFP